METYSTEFTPIEEIEWCKKRSEELYSIIKKEYQDAMAMYLENAKLKKILEKEEEREKRRKELENRSCSFCGKTTDYYAKGLCRSCWCRYNRNGTPEPKPRRIKVIPQKPPKLHWTERIVRDITGQFENPPIDLEESIYEAIKNLSEREEKAIIMHYKDELSLSDIGRYFDLSKERVRQIIEKAKVKLRRKYKRYFSLGIQGMKEEDERIEKEKERKREETRKLIEEHSTNVSIDELDINIRSYNCLLRADVKTVGDILYLCNEEPDFMALYKVRGLGRKSVEVVLNAMKKYFEVQKCGDLLTLYNE